MLSYFVHFVSSWKIRCYSDKTTLFDKYNVFRLNNSYTLSSLFPRKSLEMCANWPAPGKIATWIFTCQYLLDHSNGQGLDAPQQSTQMQNQLARVIVWESQCNACCFCMCFKAPSEELDFQWNPWTNITTTFFVEPLYETFEDNMFSKLLSPPCWLTFEWVGERDEAFETFVCDVFWRSVTTSEGKMTGTLSRRLLRRTKLCLKQFLEWTNLHKMSPLQVIRNIGFLL